MKGERPDALRFLWHFLTGRPAGRERELLIGQGRSATYFEPTPSRVRAASASWVLLHGVTAAGRHHAAVRRVARGLASCGSRVIVPEVAEWRDLHVRPELARPAFDDARAALVDDAGFRGMSGAPCAVAGFSVAGAWALPIAADPVAGVSTVLTLGAYRDLPRLATAMVIGEHDWRGRSFRYRPDVYGRWILGADLLPALEDDRWGDLGDRTAVARALRQLLAAASEHGAHADRPVYDPLIAQLAATIPAGGRAAWRLLAAPSANVVPDPAAGRALAAALAGAALRRAPALDPGPALPALRARVIALHGRHDRLVPFTETLRLAADLPAAAHAHVTVTRLVGHTKQSETPFPRSPAVLAREAAKLVGFASAVVSARA